MNESAWTKILGWPGYRVYRSEINEAAKTLRLWVRRKPDRANAKLAYQDFLTLWKYANPDIPVLKQLNRTTPSYRQSLSEMLPSDVQT